MKTVWIVTEIDLGGTSIFKVFKNEDDARNAVRATNGVFAHLEQYEVIQ